MNDRLKALDSVRGLAVLLVIFFHVLKRAGYFTKKAFLLFLSQMTGFGWVGVDVFFTLSGFLITSILLRTKGEEHYFKNFYMRRVLRIVPAYLIVLILVYAFAPDLGSEFESQKFQTLPVFLLFQQNWIAIFLDYPMTEYLWVTWSLAVEEQFYLIWPFVVYRLRKDTLAKVVLGVIVVSFLSRIIGVIFFEQVGKASIYFFFYYNSFNRFEELAIGALLAILVTYDGWLDRIRKYSIPVFLTFLSVFAILCLIAPLAPHPGYGVPLTVGGYTSAALTTAGLIAAFVTYPETSLIRRVFQNKILIFYGKYSYSLYLFHMPAAVILLDLLWHTGERGWYMYILYAVASITVTTVIAFLSWHLIEKHMLNLKKYFEYS